MRKAVGLVGVTLLLLLGTPTAAHAAYPDGVCGGSTVLAKKVHEFTHNGNTVAVAFCILQTSTLGFTFDWAKLKFLDSGLPDQNDALDKIEVNYMELHNNNTVTEAFCDQTNDWADPPYVDRTGNEYGGSADGRGCNYGNYSSSGNGPCSGFHAVESTNPSWPYPKPGDPHYGYSPVAYGSHGCKLVDGKGFYHTTTYAQTDKVNINNIETTACNARVGYRVMFQNGDISDWVFPELQASNCH